jgi:hypothetical protein
VSTRSKDPAVADRNDDWWLICSPSGWRRTSTYEISDRGVRIAHRTDGTKVPSSTVSAIRRPAAGPRLNRSIDSIRSRTKSKLPSADRLAGDDPEEDLDQVQNQVRRVGLEPTTRWLGVV